MNSDFAAAHLIIHGRVQGVGFRFFTQELAQTLELVGWVRNLPDRTVEAVAQGSRSVIEAFIDRLKEGPSMVRVDSVVVEWGAPQHNDTLFSILP